MARQVISSGRPVIFYIHPREIDPQQPRLSMNARRRFQCYVNLRHTETKVARLLAGFQYVTFRDYLSEHFAGDEGAAVAAGPVVAAANAGGIGC
jgi:isocitrate/isopropylmalate dehydrogenase